MLINKMYIQNLLSEEHPLKQYEWGNDMSHVVLNIRETEDGFMYDMIKQVETPVTVSKIVYAAAQSHFSAEILKYVAANSYNIADKIVQKYNDFCRTVAQQAIDAGYNN